MNEELLNRLLNNKNDIGKYKVRFLVKSHEGTNPLEIYKETNSIEEWIAWKYDKDILKGDKVIAFIKNYDLDNNTWLYAGTFEVSKKDNFDHLNNCVAYNLKPCGNIKDVGLLNIEYANIAQQLVRNLKSFNN